MKSLKSYFILIFVSSIILSSCNFTWRSFHTVTGVQKITKEELKVLLDNSNLTILDVRDKKDWKASNRKIPGAIRENPYDVASWADRYDKGQRLVLYCA